MFMRHGSSGRLEELGKVYVYLQRGPLLLEPGQSHLMGQQAYGRFGTSLAPLGDLNQDGFNGTCAKLSSQIHSESDYVPFSTASPFSGLFVSRCGHWCSLRGRRAAGIGPHL